MRYIGEKKIIDNLSYEYKNLADEDEKVGRYLGEIGGYRNAIYFIIQSMEKNIRAKIFERVNPNLEYYRNRNRNHSLDDSIKFLIDVISADDNIRNQIKNMFDKEVFKGLYSSSLHNSLRYPIYSKENYIIVKYSKTDFEYMLNMLERLKVFLKDIYKINN